MTYFDIFNDRIPATLVIDLVSITWGINDVQPQFHSVFNNNYSQRKLCQTDTRDASKKSQLTMRLCLDFSRLTNWLIMLNTTLGVNQMTGKNGIDERALS